jgi:hypothetical protein
MTHDRSTPRGRPPGLVITEEGTQPSADGQGYLLTPGIYTDKHIEECASSPTPSMQPAVASFRKSSRARVPHPD